MRRKPDPLVTDGQKVDLSPSDVNQRSLTASLITAQECLTARVFWALCRTAWEDGSRGQKKQGISAPFWATYHPHPRSSFTLHCRHFPPQLFATLDLPDPDTEGVHDSPSSHCFRAIPACPIWQIKKTPFVQSSVILKPLMNKLFKQLQH